MVLQNCLPPDLEQLWEQGRAKQKLVIQLCDLIVESTPDDLKVFLNLMTCCLPLWSLATLTTLPSWLLDFAHILITHIVSSEGVK